MGDVTNVLVVVAHADDESLGMGGTIRRLTASEKARVSVAVLGDGVSSRQSATADDMRERSRQFSLACKLLGAKAIGYIVDPLPDNKFDTVPQLDIAKRVEELVKIFTPSVIYTHSSSDLNIDHRITHEAVLIATRPLFDCYVRKIFAFETPSSTEWGRRQSQFSPTLFVDVRRTFAAKLAAVDCYVSERRAAPHPRSPSALKALACWRGATVGMSMAEAFEVVRIVR